MSDTLWSEYMNAWQKGFQAYGDLVTKVQETVWQQDENQAYIDSIQPTLSMFQQAAQSWGEQILENPDQVHSSQSQLIEGMIELNQYCIDKMQGKGVKPVIQADRNDRRFISADWDQELFFDLLRQYYLLISKCLMNSLEKCSGLASTEKNALKYFYNHLLNTVSPSNFVFSNPEILKTCLAEKGENLIRGMEFLKEDIAKSETGMLFCPQSDQNAFQLGDNIAVSKGKVVFRNKLIELICYTPKKASVKSVPILFVPPFINKYYILDLNEKKSMVKWLLEQGNQVFCISWVDPDESMGHYSFDEYVKAVITAFKQCQKISGSQNIHPVGYCIGGTLLTITLAYLEKTDRHVIELADFIQKRKSKKSVYLSFQGKEYALLKHTKQSRHLELLNLSSRQIHHWHYSGKNTQFKLFEGETMLLQGEKKASRQVKLYQKNIAIDSATLLASFIDFSDVGEIGMFVTPEQIEALVKRNKAHKLLKGQYMMDSFTKIRSGGLFWPYVVENYMLGKRPAPMDVLYWNQDYVNFPATFYEDYLKDLYLNNTLVEKDKFTVLGENLDLTAIQQNIFCVACKEDHIVPWQSAYQSKNVLKNAKVDFVLANSGHIMGIVHAVDSSRAHFWIHQNKETLTASEWESNTILKEGSWWKYWQEWLSDKLGEEGPAIDMSTLESLGDAPGEYVKKREDKNL